MALTATAGPAAPLRLGLGLLTTLLVWLTVFAGGFVMIEPSPHEALFALLFLLLLVRGARLHGTLALPIACLTLWSVGGGLGLAANGGDTQQTIYVLISVFLALSTIVFGMLVADDTEHWVATIRQAWLAAALMVAVSGVIGYFDLVPGASDLFALYGRAKGTFKDPNVFAPFLILPALLLLQNVLTGSRARMVGSGLVAGVLIAAIFLSFSRAAWANLLVSALVLSALMFATSSTNRVKVRLVAMGVLGLCATTGVVAALLTIPSVAEVFAHRAILLQSYDMGETGRFGTQLRSIGLLLENPFGLGPYAFADRFGQDPHNVYLNGFASYGWLGGLAYAGFVVTTWLTGLRTVLLRTPWQSFQIAVFATYTGVMLQGLLIDTDHWRHYFLLAGLIWGLSAATLGYRCRPDRARQTC